jgi:hypothetical protein
MLLEALASVPTKARRQVICRDITLVRYLQQTKQNLQLQRYRILLIPMLLNVMLPFVQLQSEIWGHEQRLQQRVEVACRSLVSKSHVLFFPSGFGI